MSQHKVPILQSFASQEVNDCFGNGEGVRGGGTVRSEGDMTFPN